MTSPAASPSALLSYGPTGLSAYHPLSSSHAFSHLLTPSHTASRLELWPNSVPITFLAFETGEMVGAGGALYENCRDPKVCSDDHNPCRLAYDKFCGVIGGQWRGGALPWWCGEHGRAAWDLMAVYARHLLTYSVAMRLHCLCASPCVSPHAPLTTSYHLTTSPLATTAYSPCGVRATTTPFNPASIPSTPQAPARTLGCLESHTRAASTSRPFYPIATAGQWAGNLTTYSCRLQRIR